MLAKTFEFQLSQTNKCGRAYRMLYAFMLKPCIGYIFLDPIPFAAYLCLFRPVNLFFSYNGIMQFSLFCSPLLAKSSAFSIISADTSNLEIFLLL